MADLLTFGLRGIAVGLAVALLLACTGSQRRARLALLPVLVCLVAYLMRSAPEAHAWPVAALLPLAVGALLFPLAFWWLVHCAFDDRADVPWSVWLAAVLMLAAGLASRPPDAVAVSLAGDGPRAVQKLTALGLVLAGLWRLWRGRAGDLVAGRRVFRGWLLAYIGAHGLAILGVELWLRGQPAPPWLDAVNVATIVATLAVTLAWLVGLRSGAVESLFGPAPPAHDEPVSTPGAAEATQAAGDTMWIDRLQRLMADEHAYREPDLSVARLAARVGLPEYRLRELIHRGLGFRNFPAFVNEYRLREVEQRLLDPACDRRPVLTLALEAGFGSIGPFNRAFRDRHGMTPTAFRSRRASAAPAA